jgi:membrane fusion protein (multidrug efflux system)
MNMRKTVVLLSLFFLLPAKAEMTARAVVSAIDRTILSAEISGNVVYLPTGDGEYFKKGALLAQIDCAIFEAQQRKIEIQKKIALYQMQKNEQLDKLNSIGAFEVLISQEEYSKQGAELDIVSVNVKRCKIYAPFNGRVVEKKVNLHQSIKAQQEILEIVGTGNLEAIVVVHATWLSWLKKGDKLTLNVDETQTDIKVIVKEIGAVVDPTSQTVLIRAKLFKPYGKIIAGMSGTATFNYTNNSKN